MTIPEQLANKDLSADVLEPLAEPPDRARVVIVGGGIIGSSIAYHLTKLGLTDVVVAGAGHAHERHDLARGGPRLAGPRQPRAHRADPHQRRSLRVAAGRDRHRDGVAAPRRRHGRAHAGSDDRDRSTASPWRRTSTSPVEILTPAEFGELWPAAVTDDLVGAVQLPHRRHGEPRRCRARVREGGRGPGSPVRARRSPSPGSRARPTGCGSRASRPIAGTIEAETVVLAAGLWTSELARLAGASVALYPAEHVWVMTEPAEGAREESPFLRDLDGYLYIRHYRGQLRDRRVRAERQADGPRPRPDRPASSSSDPTGITSRRCWRTRASACPSSRRSGSAHYLRAPESFTPDAELPAGRVPRGARPVGGGRLELPGHHLRPRRRHGRCRSGSWRAIPPMDLAEVDVARMGRWANSARWLRERTVESLGGLYEMHWPGKQPVTARGVRRIPLCGSHARGRAPRSGRPPAGSAPTGSSPAPSTPRSPTTSIEPSWFPAVRDEVRATREGVALYDLSTYSKFLVAGAGGAGRAAAALHRRTSTCRSDASCTR